MTPKQSIRSIVVTMVSCVSVLLLFNLIQGRPLFSSETLSLLKTWTLVLLSIYIAACATRRLWLVFFLNWGLMMLLFTDPSSYVDWTGYIVTTWLAALMSLIIFFVGRAIYRREQMRK